MTRKWLPETAAIVMLLVGCHSSAVPENQMERGGQWLSWTVAERSRFVHGYIDGYLGARHQACGVADELFEVNQPHQLGSSEHPSNMPSARCLAAVDQYSRFKYVGTKLDVSAYEKAITEFYTKHPEYLGVPFPFLMEFLGDKKCSTAQELYEKAVAGKLHVVR
jgi:hypothetical protein